MKYIYSCLFICYMFFSCKEKEPTKNLDKTVIPLADVVGSGEILNLSDYAKSVKYIPLEINDSVLVGNIEELIYEREHIFLYDFQSRQCRLFSEGGCHITDVGKVGQGPGEYVWILAMSYVPKTGGILLSDPIGNLLFDSVGNFINRFQIEPPEKYRILSTVAITDSLYFSHLGGGKDFRYHALVWGQKDSNQIYQILPSYLKWDTTKISNGWVASTCKWRFQNQVRSYWEETDTIFTVSSDLSFKKAFVMDLGKYKRPLDQILSIERYNRSSKYIILTYSGICESMLFRDGIQEDRG